MSVKSFDPSLSSRHFAIALLALVTLATTLRLVFPVADPPWRATVGIVWHDEGAWVHNARNKALFGTWRLDEWNPMFIAPVFTGLEYASFRAFGVGLSQARLVSEVAGIFSVVLLGLGMARLAGRRAGLFAAGLLATNYVWVMWNRAALLETTMTGFVVVAFYAYARATTSPSWGALAGLSAWLAYFSKAAAVFFLPALALVAAWPVVERTLARRTGAPSVDALHLRAGICTLVGLAAGGLLGLALFVGPNWHDYWFYNWQMSVTRKPSYTFKAVVDRLSWFPVLHDVFTRMWLVLVVAAAGVLGRLVQWRRLAPGEQLLVAWVVVGVVELIAHDVGNERRFVVLIPPLVAMTAMVLGRDGRLFPLEVSKLQRSTALLGAPLLLYVLYVVVAPLARLPFLYEVRPGVRLSAALAFAAGMAVYLAWPRVARLAATSRVSPGAAVLVVALVMMGDLAQFGQWAYGRTYRNYEALRVVAERLPPGTLVHGKLANGLALESRIRPVFVGNGFGNFADRLERDDIRYVLTYVSPRLGYEGPIILDVLRAYPERRVLWTVPVAETTCDCDRAALVEKRPASPAGARP